MSRTALFIESLDEENTDEAVGRLWLPQDLNLTEEFMTQLTTQMLEEVLHSASWRHSRPPMLRLFAFLRLLRCCLFPIEK
jgi:hypothetical protein